MKRHYNYYGTDCVKYIIHFLDIDTHGLSMYTLSMDIRRRGFRDKWSIYVYFIYAYKGVRSLRHMVHLYILYLWIWEGDVSETHGPSMYTSSFLIRRRGLRDTWSIYVYFIYTYKGARFQSHMVNLYILYLWIYGGDILETHGPSLHTLFMDLKR